MATHKVEINCPRFAWLAELVIDGVIIRTDEPAIVETSQLTLGLLLTPQLRIDGATFEARMGLPEALYSNAPATQALAPMPSSGLERQSGTPGRVY